MIGRSDFNFNARDGAWGRGEQARYAFYMRRSKALRGASVGGVGMWPNVATQLARNRYAECHMSKALPYVLIVIVGLYLVHEYLH
jgi:hypothetical protein